MKKLSVKDVVDFKRKSERSKKTFVTNLKLEKQKKETDKGGGDYWKICLSAISRSYETNDQQIIKDKINEFEEKIEQIELKVTIQMYQRNIDILKNYEGFDFQKWKLSKKQTYLPKPKNLSILTIKGLEIQASPHHVFTYNKNDSEEIGAIWFVAIKNGLKKDELGIFADILYKYLKTHYAKEYTINSKYCIAVDVVKLDSVNYSQIEKAETRALLIPTIDEIKKLL